MNPSPRPWHILPYDNEEGCIGGDNRIYDADYYHLVTLDGYGVSSEKDDANAAHIVRCVNLHDELVTRLEAMCDLAELQGGFDDEDGMRVVERARETLEKARKADA